ncbi:capsular polysaccharide export protein, LipB/KpsS family [Kozakia baliensis]|uniref:capsular polysaccharide export protein, LipB/KpsS family n=1 Tax=Kozakia baliensis TaxID=153496 RepID=UPI001313DB4E|nr:hypothetical protein [Kozakia baliensis]
MHSPQKHMPGAELTVFIAPPVRKTPPFSEVLTDWNDVSPRHDGDREVLFAKIREARVGGTFWAAEAPQIEEARYIVAMPRSMQKAQALWRRVSDAEGAPFALVYFEHTPDQELLCDIEAKGGHYIVGPYDSHGLLRRNLPVWLAEMNAFGILALAYDRAVQIWPSTQESVVRADPAQAYAFLTQGMRYRSPYTGKNATIEEIVRFLSTWRRTLEANRKIAVCLGISWWKRNRIGHFLEAERQPAFCRTGRVAVAQAARRGGGIAVWCSRIPGGLPRYAAEAKVPLYLVEDGFIRSVGLGSDLLPPSSIVVDSRGIYFDPSRPSDLEHMLAHGEFDDVLCERARRLIEILVEGKITKYGAGTGQAPDIAAAAGQKVILVPGQVADDLSVRLGAGEVRSNKELLMRVRRDNPEAYVIYRPHPDVDAGHRRGVIPDEEALLYADQICRGGTISALIDISDEVHTMTSLAGFEALLRKKKTVTYGYPFYAGWGLTEERAPSLSRRGRSLSLEALVAATIILYPRYMDPVTNLPCEPEILIDRLSELQLWRPSFLMKIRQKQGRLRRAIAQRLDAARR